MRVRRNDGGYVYQMEGAFYVSCKYVREESENTKEGMGK